MTISTSITPLDSANTSAGTGGSVAVGREINVFTRAVTGGTLYITVLRGEGASDPVAVSTNFVPAAVTPANRQLHLTDASGDNGVILSATPGSGSMGILRTAGTSLVLGTETTTANAKTDKAMWEFHLPDTYIAGSAIQFSVNANYAGAGTITAASTSINAAVYTESAAGVEAAVTMTGGAQTLTGTAATYSWVLTAASATASSLVAGSRLVFETTMVITSSGSNNTGQIGSVSYTA